MGSSDFVDYPTLGSSDFLPGLESKRLLMNDRRGWSRILEYQIWLNGQDWIGFDWFGDWIGGESETNSLPPAPPGMLITVAVAMLSSIYRSKNLSSFENTLPDVSSFKDIKSPPARVSLPLTNGCNCTIAPHTTSYNPFDLSSKVANEATRNLNLSEPIWILSKCESICEALSGQRLWCHWHLATACLLSWQRTAARALNSRSQRLLLLLGTTSTGCIKKFIIAILA